MTTYTKKGQDIGKQVIDLLSTGVNGLSRTDVKDGMLEAFKRTHHTLQQLAIRQSIPTMRQRLR